MISHALHFFIGDFLLVILLAIQPSVFELQAAARIEKL
jgi:hypothetical protein